MNHSKLIVQLRLDTWNFFDYSLLWKLTNFRINVHSKSLELVLDDSFIELLLHYLRHATGLFTKECDVNKHYPIACTILKYFDQR